MVMSTASKRVYLAGPMSNRPYFNFKEFFRHAADLRLKGYTVCSPAEHDMALAGDFYTKCPNGTNEELIAATDKINYRECMKFDLNWIMDQADAIALMPDWEKSSGARVEKGLADLLKLEVIYL